MLRTFIAFFLALGISISGYSADSWTVKQREGLVEIRCNDQFAANYVQKSGTKPIVWPIVGPTGAEMTRAYPMRTDDAKEKRDHVHHRSLWFTYGDVNGISFWMEEGKEKPGTIEHREYKTLNGGEKAIVETTNDWLSPSGDKVCSDERKLVFFRESESLVIDYDIRLIASAGELRLGDTKEGAFGVRVPTSMDVDAKQGGKIVNSEGKTNAEAWGGKASWVDYHGPVEGKTCGIAILNHPSSYRYPNRWHVRTYGLFAANPFGEKEFPGGDAKAGTHVVAAGESISLRYRVIFHAGDEKEAGIEAAFTKYAAEK